MVAKGTLDQWEINAAFMHSLLGEEASALLKICFGTIQNSSNLELLANTMTWVTGVGIGVDIPIPKRDQNLEFFFRLTQFRLAEAVGDTKQAIKLIDLLMAMIDAQEYELEFHKKLAVYGYILMALNIFVPSELIVTLALKLKLSVSNEQIAEYEAAFKASSSVNVNFTGLDAKILSFHPMRFRGTADLREFVEVIDRPKDEDRIYLLGAFGTDVELTNVTVGNVWLKDTKAKSLSLPRP